jgi:hypothetical protein
LANRRQGESRPDRATSVITYFQKGQIAGRRSNNVALRALPFHPPMTRQLTMSSREIQAPRQYRNNKNEDMRRDE